jgi:DNA-directed RNA polymerase specialized sigma24 family protein
MPKGIKPDEQRTLNHMMRGLTQQQVAYAEGVSESAISQRLKRMRSRLYD